MDINRPSPSRDSTLPGPADSLLDRISMSPPTVVPPQTGPDMEQRPSTGPRWPSHQSHFSNATVDSTETDTDKENGGTFGPSQARPLDSDNLRGDVEQAVPDSVAAPLMFGTNLSSRSASEKHQMHESFSAATMLSDPATPWSRSRAERRATRNLRTVLLIFGGWGTIIAACLIFKIVAIRVNLVVPDSMAANIKKHPQLATQVFTILGNIIAEACLVLWSSSVSYLAFRAVVFGEKIELLTLTAWSELARGGYTFSRRKVAWPIFTPIIWLGALFLAPGFTTLITPIPSTKNSPILTRETDHLSLGFVNQFVENFLDGTGATLLPINAQLLPTCSDHLEVLAGNSTSVITCLPGTTDYHTSRQASQASLQAYLNVPRPYISIFGGWQFWGRTRGLIPLGPDGLVALTDADFKEPQPGATKPEGFQLKQQGLSARAKCQEMTQAQRDAMITIEQLPQRADTYRYGANCPNDTALFNTAPTLNTMVATKASSSIVPLICVNTDIDRPSSRTHTMYLVTRGDGASAVLNTTMCTITPYWHETVLSYPSTTGILNASTETTQFLSYIDRTGTTEDVPETPYDEFINHFIGDPSLVARNYMTIFNALSLFSSVLYSNTLMSAVNTTGTGELGEIGGFSILENNQVLQHLQNIVLDHDVKSAVTMPMLEQYLLGIWDFHSTTTRQFQTAVLRIIGNDTLKPFAVNDNFNDPSVTRPCRGVWRGSTLSWGTGSPEDDVNPTVVFISLLPPLFFALISWGISLYAHIKYRNGKLAYYGSFDPCDPVQAIIAASSGGMVDAFNPRALTEDAGLYGARKVSVRLGRISSPSDSGGKVKIGYVAE
ncbi:hypothetical protein A4X09_0g395 [Tilletia walkeri]|uniref:Uncharacterized protein n=1 Tax=Tilletia walkeri TaxID=117179 RepID=A0A8X7T8G2_9BASI|nr:hypothetical protein A4X09_0g395 [Tilletia walkeri]